MTTDSQLKVKPVIHCEVIQAIEDTWTANIFVICLDKPGSEHNIIDYELGLQFARVLFAVREKVREGEVDLVVLCSAKHQSFMAGADIQFELRSVGTDGETRYVCMYAIYYYVVY